MKARSPSCKLSLAGKEIVGKTEGEHSGPVPLSDILTELFTARGYGRLQAANELEDAWNTAVGDPQFRQTRVGAIKRGVLNVTVAHPILLEELAGFRKSTLLAALRRAFPDTAIHDIRFRVGPVD